VKDSSQHLPGHGGILDRVRQPVVRDADLLRRADVDVARGAVTRTQRAASHSRLDGIDRDDGAPRARSTARTLRVAALTAFETPSCSGAGRAFHPTFVGIVKNGSARTMAGGGRVSRRSGGARRRRHRDQCGRRRRRARRDARRARARKRVALANKETLVMAGQLVERACARAEARSSLSTASTARSAVHRGRPASTCDA
jgi:hypothetical protein